MTNHFGGGKHIWSIPPEDTIPFWKVKNRVDGVLQCQWLTGQQWEAGWCGYYIVLSMVKVSMCYGFLEMCIVAPLEILTPKLLTRHDDSAGSVQRISNSHTRTFRDHNNAGPCRKRCLGFPMQALHVELRLRCSARSLRQH